MRRNLFALAVTLIVLSGGVMTRSAAHAGMEPPQSWRADEDAHGDGYRLIEYTDVNDDGSIGGYRYAEDGYTTEILIRQSDGSVQSISAPDSETVAGPSIQLAPNAAGEVSINSRLDAGWLWANGEFDARGFSASEPHIFTTGVNDNGEVGFWEPPYTDDRRGGVVTRTGERRYLAAPANAFAAPLAIAADGTTTGATFTPGITGRATRWAPDGSATVLPITSPLTYSIAFGINNVGDAVGYAFGPSGVLRAMLWPHDGGVIDITPPQLEWAISLSVADDGTAVVAGRSNNGRSDKPGPLRSFLWTAGSFAGVHIVNSPSYPAVPFAISPNGQRLVGATQPDDGTENGLVLTPAGNFADVSIAVGPVSTQLPIDQPSLASGLPLPSAYLTIEENQDGYLFAAGVLASPFRVPLAHALLHGGAVEVQKQI